MPLCDEDSYSRKAQRKSTKINLSPNPTAGAEHMTWLALFWPCVVAITNIVTCHQEQGGVEMCSDVKVVILLTKRMTREGMSAEILPFSFSLLGRGTRHFRGAPAVLHSWCAFCEIADWIGKEKASSQGD